MQTELQTRISDFLRARADWVPTAEICDVFGVSERQLRGLAGDPGLVSSFAISRVAGGGGFKHVLCATSAEYLHFKHAMRRHGIMELKRVRALDRERHHAVRQLKDIAFEKDTRQVVMNFAVERVA